MRLRPARIASAARLLQPALLEALALDADSIAEDLQAKLHMVAWDRIQLIGQAQRALMALRERRFKVSEGEPARVLERADQPLECLELTWTALRHGRPVFVEFEAGACPQVHALLDRFRALLGEAVLGLGELGAPTPEDVQARPSLGVERARARVAALTADADRETAAYVLARASLRRCGFDPRAVHRLYVAGATPRLVRTLRRLWVGARMGDAADLDSFAGPVDAASAERYLEAEAAWREHPAVQTLCVGGRLVDEAEDGGVFLAPSLFEAPRELDADLPEPCGPMLVLHPLGEVEPRATLAAADERSHGGRLLLGEFEGPLELGPEDRHVRGALLLERLPPGLPEPRP